MHLPKIVTVAFRPIQTVFAHSSPHRVQALELIPQLSKQVFFTVVALATSMSSNMVIAHTIKEQAATPLKWQIIDLGTLGGRTSSPTAINNQGQIAGVSETASGQFHAFFWSLDGGMMDLGTLGGDYSLATSMNDQGQVTGYSALSGSTTNHAFIWSKDSGMIDIGTLGGEDSSTSDINNAGQVVGISRLASGDSHPFLWSKQTGMIDLAPPETQYGTGTEINDAGLVAGYYSPIRDSREAQRPFLWTQQQGFIDIGTLGGGRTQPRAMNAQGQITGQSRVPSGEAHGFYWSKQDGIVDLGISSNPVAIDNQGQIVGTAFTITGTRAFVWSIKNGMTDLGTLPGFDSSGASAINLHGQIVGSSGAHAFVWTAEEGLMDLGTLGNSSSAAYDINDHGQIVGTSDALDGNVHTVIWSPKQTISNLDLFDRTDGRLRGLWVGAEGLGGYTIRGQAVNVIGGGPIYWNGKVFAPAQQVAATLSQLDTQRREHGLVLKAQGNPPNWRKGYIHIAYFSDDKTVQVSAYQPDRGIWTDYAPISVTFLNGDQLGAQAWPDGRVRIFRNKLLVGSVQLNAKDQAFYSTRGGRIGIWFNGYGAQLDARFDDFGGGDISLPATTLSQSSNEFAEGLPWTNESDVAVITAYTERNHPRGEILFERLHLPVLVADGA